MPSRGSPAGLSRRRRFVGAARALLAGLLLACTAAAAEPSPPWLPDAAARHRLELLADEAGLALPLTHWPLPRRAVEAALDALPATLPTALDAARAQLREDLHGQTRGQLALRLRGHGEILAGYGDDATAGSGLSARSPVLATPQLALQAGVRADAAPQPGASAARARLEGSAIATEALGVQLQAWSHRGWWGPGWQDSLVLGGNAPAFDGLGLQRAGAGRSASPWLAWLGPWTFEFFVAQAEGGSRAVFVGNRLTARPLPLLEVGLTRTAQWGGEGHPHSLKSFGKMLFGIGVNANAPGEAIGDPGNQMAGFDLRLRCPGGRRCAGYAQAIGEDSTHHVPSRFLGLYGLEAWSADGRQRWFAELVESVCGAVLEHHPLRPCAYRNYAYPEGYTHAGRWIGAAAGSDSRVLTLGWLDAARGTSLRLHSGRVGSRIGSFTPDPNDPRSSGRLVGAALRQDFRWRDTGITAELDWLRVHAPQGDRTEARVGATLRF